MDRAGLILALPLRGWALRGWALRGWALRGWAPMGWAPMGWALMGCALMGCAPRVPVPVVASQEGAEPMPVPYPPPAAHAEIIPPQPDDEAVWVDGYWMWKGADYSWSAGRWVVPGPGMAYAPAEVVRLRDGKLMFYPPRWTRSAQKE